MTRIVHNSRRSRTSCSLFALATVLAVGATPAAAQSLNGTGVFANGSGSITTGAGTTTVNLTSTQSVINWTPTDNATGTTANIVFQNAGTTATFWSNSDFAVLNNINSASISRAIEMNGTVNARVGSATGAQRGSVYFYAPGGFVFGGGSSFSVGSLVVSALPIQVSGGNFITGFGTANTVTFGQAVNPAASITMGGTVSANFAPLGVPTPASSYVALVAPKVIHTGTINVNGSAALVAAEAATMSFSPDGLFDIQVTAGTTDSQGLSVSGDITGPTPTGSTDKQNIFLVAVPKNQALTMALSSGADIGFTLANNATVDQYGAVILSAGHDIDNGVVAGVSSGQGTGTGSFQVAGAHFTNNVTGEATGNADIVATAGQTTKFDSNLDVHADGHAWMSSSGVGALVNVLGDVTLSTDATSSVEGGSATGGYTSLFTNNSGVVTIGGDLTLTADGYGGASNNSGIAGGTGTGGHAQLQIFGGTVTVGTVNGGGNVLITATGFGGDGAGNGGLGKGGFAEATVENGTLTVHNALDAEAIGKGGSSGSFGFTSGAGEGGHVLVRAAANGTFLVNEDLDAEAGGEGGFVGFQSISGNGTGGNIEVQAQGANAKLDTNILGGDTTLQADGVAGDDGECIGCGGGVGTGKGGTIVAGSDSGASLLLHGNLTMSANGVGAVGVDRDGGKGTGGTVKLYAADNSTTHVFGDVYAHADGEGGWRYDGGYGGDLPVLAGEGVGGLAELFTFGTAGNNPQLLVGGNANLYAEGTGGDVYQTASGTGGKGTGGQAWLDSQLGTIHISGGATLSATGNGGNAAGGTGGDGLGRNAEIDALGGSVLIDGSATVDASGFGGNGDTGGNGTGGGELFDDGSWVDGAVVFASKSSVTIGGDLNAKSSGYGGDGANGGNGGAGTGGMVRVQPTNNNAGPSSITVNGVESTTYLTAEGHGGAGGLGTSGNTGGDGGNGGDALGGSVSLFGSAGNGTLTVNSANLSVQAFGGDGGNGGNGDGGAGGNGGDGGNAGGGFINVGTGSGNQQALASNLGSGNYGSIYADASATGGRGGDGNFGSVGGNGGNGGDAVDGGAILLVRGSVVNVDDVTLIANATGGDAGFGYFMEGGTSGTTGIGGDATVGGDGGIAVLVTGRFLNPAQRGTLNAGTINGTAIATAGIGIPNGQTFSAGSNQVTFLNADGDIGSIDFQVSLGDNPSTSGNDFISIINGTVDVTGELSFVTPGDFSFYIDSGALNFDSLALHAGNFIHDPLHPSGPAIIGSASGNSVDIQTGQDFIADANWDVTNTFFVDAPGLIDVDNVHDDNSIDFTAGGSINVLNATAGESIDFDAGGNVTGGNLTSGDEIEVAADGNVNLGNLSSGLVNPSSNPEASFNTAILAGGNIVTGNIASAHHVGLAAQGTATTGTIDADGVLMGLIHGNMSFGAINTGEGIYLADYSMMALGGTITGEFDPAPIIASLPTLTGGSITFNSTVDTDGFMTAGAGTNMNFLNDLTVGTSAVLYAGNAINLKNVDAGYFYANAGGKFTSLDLTSGSNVHIEAGDDVGIGHLVAGLTSDPDTNKAIRIISDGSVSLIDINSVGGIDITAAGNVTGGNVTTGDGLFTDAVGSITYANISAGLVNPQTPSEILSMALAAGTSINVGNVDTAIGAAFISPGTVTTGNVDGGTGDVLGLVHGNISMGDISGDRVYLADYSMYTDIGGTIPTSDSVDEAAVEGIFTTTPVKTGGSITVGDVNAGSFTAAAGTDLTFGILNVDGGLTVDAGGAISTGDLNVGDFVLANGGSITTGDINSFSVDMTSTAGNITTGDVLATGDVSMDAFGDIVTGDITAGSIDLHAGDDITTGDLTTQQLLFFAAADGGITTLSFPGASISLESGGDISTGNIDSIDGVWANAGGSLTSLNIDAVDFVDLTAVNNIATGYIDAGSYIYVNSTSGGIDTGNLTGSDIQLDAATTIAFDDVDGYDFDFDAGGNVNGGNIVVTDRVSGGSGGNVLLGNINAGPIVPFNDFSVGIGAVGNITVGNVTGAGPVGFAASGTLSTGNLSSGNLVMLLVGGNITTGSITTPNAPGAQVYIGDDSIFFANGGTISGDGDFDALAALQQFPAATGGSITINGPVTTGGFRAAAGTSLTTQAITAANIEAQAGGLATINGVWNASNDAELRSNDIDITGTGRMNAANILTLISTNPNQIVVGDGVTTSGYLLSDAEFGRLSGGSVYIAGRGDASAAIDMIVGNLTVDNPTTGSTLTDPNGALVFAVGDIDTLTPSGVIRVVGNVNAPEMGSGQSMEFYATRFELDSAIGSISLTSGGALSGELGLYADRIHVAQAAILDKLAADPKYLNYQQDLNNAAPNQRPDGVLRADTLWIESENLQDVLIQNMGTSGQNGAPAGFLVRQAFINDDFDTAGPAGSINLVVNGQVVTEGGTLTGVAARDFLVPEGTDITPFTSNSTINGCPLTGECIIKPPQPPPTANVVENQIDLITGDSLGDSDFGNEDSIDDNSEGDDGADNPISPPQPLFDTRPLVPSGDVDDPVSGTGNPSLIGSDADCDDASENGQCPAPVKGDGQ